MDEPRVGKILEVLYRIWIEELARVASNNRICSE